MSNKPTYEQLEAAVANNEAHIRQLMTLRERDFNALVAFKDKVAFAVTIDPDEWFPNDEVRAGFLNSIGLEAPRRTYTVTATFDTSSRSVIEHLVESEVAAAIERALENMAEIIDIECQES